MLPQERSQITRRNPRKLLLYGPPKIGKTTFLAALDSNLIFDLEKGTSFVSSLSVEASTLEDIKKFAKEVVAANKPYKYISIDTVTKLEELCEWDATECYMKSVIGRNFNAGKQRNEWESVLTLPQGGGYFWLRESVKSWVNALSTLADTLILTAHVREKSLEKKGKEVSYKDLDLTGKIRNILSSDMDAIGYMYRDDGDLRINFKSTDEVVCGARSPHLAGQDISAEWNRIFID